MEIHRELGKGHDEVIYKDPLVIELSRAGIPFSREKITKSHTKELSYINILSLSGERVRRPHTHRAMAVRGGRPLGLGRSVAFR